MDGEVVTTPVGGYTICVAIPQPLSLVHFEDRPRVEQPVMAPSLKTGTYRHVEQLVTPSGERVLVRLWEGER